MEAGNEAGVEDLVLVSDLDRQRVVVVHHDVDVELVGSLERDVIGQAAVSDGEGTGGVANLASLLMDGGLHARQGGDIPIR